MRSSTWVGACVVMLFASACGGRVNDDGAGGLPGPASSGGSAGASNGTSGPGNGQRGTTTPPQGEVGSGAAGRAGAGIPGAGGAVGMGVPGTGGAVGMGIASHGFTDAGVSPPPIATAVPPVVTSVPPTPVPPPGDAGARAPDYVLGGLTSDGHVVAAFWNGTAEEIVSVDPTSGVAVSQGQPWGLAWWSSQFVYDDRTRMAYAIGQDQTGASRVYSWNLEKQDGLEAPFEQANSSAVDYVLGGSTRDGHLVVAYWTGTQEAVALLDPASAESVFAGTLGDLYQWQSQLAYDDTSHVVYAIGQNRASAERVYSLSLDTKQSTVAELGGADGGAPDYVLGGVTRDGRLIAAYWNGTEAVAILDPATGSLAFAGSMNGLHLWQSQFLYGGPRGTAVAYGQDLSGMSHFYEVPIGE